MVCWPGIRCRGGQSNAMQMILVQMRENTAVASGNALQWANQPISRKRCGSAIIDFRRINDNQDSQIVVAMEYKYRPHSKNNGCKKIKNKYEIQSCARLAAK
eukprot:4567666-Pleurochrysis_carterae.AAC.1